MQVVVFWPSVNRAFLRWCLAPWIMDNPRRNEDSSRGRANSQVSSRSKKAMQKPMSVPAIMPDNAHPSAFALTSSSPVSVSELFSLPRCCSKSYEERESGWGGIRTPGRVNPTPVFKTGALNRSATHPAIEQPAFLLLFLKGDCHLTS